MPIETVCPRCTGRMRVPVEYAGKQIRCGACKSVVTVAPMAIPVEAPPAIVPLEAPPVSGNQVHAVPSLLEQSEISLRLQVVRDSAGKLRGRTSAFLTADGLHLCDQKSPAARPGQCTAK